MSTEDLLREASNQVTEAYKNLRKKRVAKDFQKVDEERIKRTVKEAIDALKNDQYYDDDPYQGITDAPIDPTPRYMGGISDEDMAYYTDPRYMRNAAYNPLDGRVYANGELVIPGGGGDDPEEAAYLASLDENSALNTVTTDVKKSIPYNKEDVLEPIEITVPPSNKVAYVPDDAYYAKLSDDLAKKQILSQIKEPAPTSLPTPVPNTLPNVDENYFRYLRNNGNSVQESLRGAILDYYTANPDLINQMAQDPRWQH